MAMSEWRSRWDDIRRAVIARGATGRWAQGADKPPRFEVAPPATEEEVRRIESHLGQVLPPSLRQVLREFSARVCIEWALPDEVRPPEPFHGVWAGECRWDINQLPALQKTYGDWVEGCFTGQQPAGWVKPPNLIEWDLVWHEKFAFLEVGNGDMLAIDVAATGRQPVVYLSHDDSSVHGYRLGNDFQDYVDRLTALAFVGAEEWQLLPFLCDRTSGLQTTGSNAVAWRRWLDVPADVA